MGSKYANAFSTGDKKKQPWQERLWPMRNNPEGLRFSNSDKRFEVVVAGRRSGKTERAKRKFILRAMVGNGGNFLNPRYCACAPTTSQAKKIFWNDFKMMIPPIMLAKKPNETELSIKLKNGAEIFLAGLDQPARIEGSPVDGFIFDETDDIKSDAWEAHIYPCLIDRHAWAMFLGAPNGMQTLYELSKNATLHPNEWDYFHWKSAEVLDPDEIARFRALYDERLFKQEFEGEFLTFDGRAYYAFEPEHYRYELEYNPYNDLIFAFDFNSSPGVAVIMQEQKMPYGQVEECHTQGGYIYDSGIKKKEVWGTGIIGEIWIREFSNTEIVCRALYEKWNMHKGRIICYGDASGGNKTSSGIAGSDWDLIQDFFKKTPFSDRIVFRVPKYNPPVRGRINAVNCRLKSADGTMRLAIDASQAPHVINDFEKVSLIDGSMGEINKKKDPMLTHLSDAIGCYIAYEFPVDNISKVSISDW